MTCSLARAGAALALAAVLAVASGARAAGREPRFAGQVYTGRPVLALTSALLAAGGRPFDLHRALTAMAGRAFVVREIGALDRRYGREAVEVWLVTADRIVDEAAQALRERGEALPPPSARLRGGTLALNLARAGTGRDGAFHTGKLLDTLAGHAVTRAIARATVVRGGPLALANVDALTARAFADLSAAEGASR